MILNYCLNPANADVIAINCEGSFCAIHTSAWFQFDAYSYAKIDCREYSKRNVQMKINLMVREIERDGFLSL
jgi:hypothetical protein